MDLGFPSSAKTSIINSFCQGRAFSYAIKDYAKPCTARLSRKKPFLSSPVLRAFLEAHSCFLAASTVVVNSKGVVAAANSSVSALDNFFKRSLKGRLSDRSDFGPKVWRRIFFKKLRNTDRHRHAKQ